MTLGGFANAHRIEIGTLKKETGGVFGDAGAQAAVNTGNAHTLLFIADHQVVSAELDLVAVKGHEGGSLRQIFDNHLVTLNHIGIESMHGLS